MNKFDKIIELINWIKIFLSPFIISVVAAILLFLSSENYWLQVLSVIIIILGIILGVYFAEKIRKKQGTERFMAKIYESPDLDNLKSDKQQ
jgi:membrane protein YdbS with pleckstrin-like domain